MPSAKGSTKIKFHHAEIAVFISISGGTKQSLKPRVQKREQQRAIALLYTSTRFSTPHALERDTIWLRVSGGDLSWGKHRASVRKRKQA
jgi:hypothetical protein